LSFARSWKCDAGCPTNPWFVAICWNERHCLSSLRLHTPSAYSPSFSEMNAGVQMALGCVASPTARHELGGTPRVRHLLLLVTAVCLALVLPLPLSNCLASCLIAFNSVLNPHLLSAASSVSLWCCHSHSPTALHPASSHSIRCSIRTFFLLRTST
jgi:hypothetical protein